VFSGWMSILLNGSPTEEVVICRGIRQRSPFEQFLFLLAAERWSVLMSKEDEGWFYQ